MAVVGVAVAAMIFAVLYGDLVALLGTFAFGTFAAALAPAVAVGLNWKRVTGTAAVALIATGMVVSFTLEFLAKQTFFPALPACSPPRSRWRRPSPSFSPSPGGRAATVTTISTRMWRR